MSPVPIPIGQHVVVAIILCSVGIDKRFAFVFDVIVVVPLPLLQCGSRKLAKPVVNYSRKIVD